MHDAFFDRVITGALDRGVTQFVLVGTGQEGRAQRHGRPGTRWWEVDAGGAATPSGFESDSPALFCCDGVASGPALTRLLGELRALATPGTRLALALPAGAADEDLGRWRAVEISERAQRAGLRLLAPVWAPAPSGAPPSAGRIARFTERMLYRSGGEAVAGHLESVYGVTVRSTRELDLGVHRVDLAGGGSWIARIFPAVRDAEAVRQDAQLLTWLAAAGFPAERCARPEPASVLDGQSVLVTERAPGRALAGRPASFEPDASPAEEVAAIRTLLHDARHRVPAGAGDRYDALVAAAISGYRESVTLEPGEVDRLGAAMRLRPLVLACWTFATGRGKLAGAAAYWDEHARRVEAGAGYARAALGRP